MSDFTYEKSNQKTPLETYEWDNTWIEQSNRSDLPRVLYIGDSISCGARKIATERSNGRLLFDGFGSSKSPDHPYITDSVRIFAAQQTRRDAIIVNFGLHGWHLSDLEEYRLHYGRFLDFLAAEYAGAPILVALTTSVRDESREARVKLRNEVARSLAAERGLGVIDLYTLSCEQVELRAGDGVHFTREGYEKFADLINESIFKLI